jgi:hypothetical protein|tara:strand:- start:65 stop:637 length:573 start_codon:yes stop_codon:yes gene_type:complete
MKSTQKNIDEFLVTEKFSIFSGICPLDINKQMIEDAKKQSYPNTNKTNVKAKMTGWNVHTPTTDKLTNWIKEIIIDVTKTYHTTYEVVDSWFAHYTQGDHTINHCHYPQMWSFVYFVQSSPNSAPLVFTTSRTAVQPEQNRVVIFPSWIYHFVPNNNSDDRIVFSGNIGVDNSGSPIGSYYPSTSTLVLN